MSPSFRFAEMDTDPVRQALDALRILFGSGSTTLGTLVCFLTKAYSVDNGQYRVRMNCTFACDALSALLRLG